MNVFESNELSEYKSEAKERWGQTDAYKEHIAKTKDYTKDKWSELTHEMSDIFGEFALCMKSGKSPDTEEAQKLVIKLQEHITSHYYQCTDEILAGLGQMYVLDERFKNNIDKHTDGTAEYVAKAIELRRDV